MSIRRIAGWSICGLIAVVAAALVYSAFRPSSQLKVGILSAVETHYPAGSIPYLLPTKRFIIAMTTKVTGCEVRGSANPYAEEEIRGVTKVTITDWVDADVGQRYYIYPEGPRGTSINYQVELYDNGTLKSVAASVRDEVAPITASIVGAAVKFIPLIPPPAAGPGIAPGKNNCTDLVAAIEKNPEDARLVLRDEQIWTPAPSSNYRDSVSVRFPPSFLYQFGLYRPRWRWPGVSLQIEHSPKMESNSPIEFYSGGKKCTDESLEDLTKGPERDRAPCLANGLILRTTAIGRLRYRVCDEMCDAVPPDQYRKISAQRSAYGEPPGSPLTEYPSVATTVPQFGDLILLPIHSGYARNSALEVALSPDGAVRKLELKSESVLATNISTIGESAKGLGSSLVPGAKPTVTDTNKRLADCLAAQKAVIDHGGTPVGTCP